MTYRTAILSAFAAISALVGYVTSPTEAADIPVEVNVGDYGYGTPLPAEVDACPGEVILYGYGTANAQWFCEHSYAFVRTSGNELGMWSIDGEVRGYMHNEDDTYMVRIPNLPR